MLVIVNDLVKAQKQTTEALLKQQDVLKKLEKLLSEELENES